MPTEKNITKVDPKSKLLYVTLAIPLIGATVALSFGDPTCVQDLGGGDETVTSDVDTTSSTVTSETTTSISASTSADTSDTESMLGSAEKT